MVPRLPVTLWLAVLARPAAMPTASHAAGPGTQGSACPASRHPVQVGDPRLARFWSAAAAFDRLRYGFSPLLTTGDVILEHHLDEGAAVIHMCQLPDRTYRTIHFRLGRGEVQWIGEQQSFRSGRTFEDDDDGTILEELILDYETEPVVGFPLNRLNILYRGPVSEGAGPSASPTLEETLPLLRGRGF